MGPDRNWNLETASSQVIWVVRSFWWGRKLRHIRIHFLNDSLLRWVNPLELDVKQSETRMDKIEEYWDRLQMSVLKNLRLNLRDIETSDEALLSFMVRTSLINIICVKISFRLIAHLLARIQETIETEWLTGSGISGTPIAEEDVDTFQDVLSAVALLSLRVADSIAKLSKGVLAHAKLYHKLRFVALRSYFWMYDFEHLVRFKSLLKLKVAIFPAFYTFCPLLTNECHVIQYQTQCLLHPANLIIEVVFSRKLCKQYALFHTKFSSVTRN